MKCLTVSLLLFSTAACNDGPSLGRTGLAMVQPVTSAPPAVAASVREVTIGERVEGVFGDGRTIRPADQHFLVTAPSDGTLEVSLQWNPAAFGTLLLLRLDVREFSPVPPAWSPVSGRIRVEAGKRYLIVVGLAGADWLPEDPFVLTSLLGP